MAGQRFEVAPVDAHAGLMAFGIMMGALVLWDVVRRFRNVASTTIGIHARAVVARSRHGTVVLPFTDMGRVRVDRFLTGARLNLRAPGVPTLILSRRDAHRIATALEAVGVDCDVRDGAGVSGAELAPGETVLWSGRPGLRSFDRTRWMLAVMGGAPAIVFAIWLQRIWTGPGLLLDRLLSTFTALAFVGGTAMTVLMFHAGTIGDWLRDMVGAVVVTDDRVAWRAPFGGIYREIAAARILSADLIESDGWRGWVGLRVEGERPGQARDVDLFGLPDPEGAVGAIRSAMTASLGQRPRDRSDPLSHD